MWLMDCIIFPVFPLDEEMYCKLFMLEKSIEIIATIVTDLHP